MKISAFTKTYGGRTVLDMPETELEPGASYAVIGANGSGKSTLARILAGVEKPDGGKTVISGITVGYMPQKSYAFRMTVMRNLLVGAKPIDFFGHCGSQMPTTDEIVAKIKSMKEGK